MIDFIWFLEVNNIFWNFLNRNKSRNYIIASAFRHADLSRSTGAIQLKPDQWGPLVSDPGLCCVAGRWDQVNGHVSKLMLTRGSTDLLINLTILVIQ